VKGRKNQIMKKRLVSAILCAVMTMSLFAGCGRKSENGETPQNAAQNTQTPQENVNQGNNQNTAKGQVYYLSFKPEVDKVWKELAQQYTNETGVPVKVVTAASGTYEQTLMSEIANTEAPTLFQVNGPTGYQSWKEYCADLKDTELYDWLLDKSIAITGEDGGVYAIPYVVEGYGIIYNNAIMDEYFALDGAKASSMEEIKNFKTLKAVVEDMQSKKDDLGIEGVFASTSLTPGEDWRWQTHLANVPIAYEYKDKGVTNLDTLDFTYAENFKNIFDLYIHNSCTAPGLLGNKSVDDSMAEFALGQVAMVQNGNWAWSQIADMEGNTVTEEDVRFLPIYTGIKGEEGQGLCVGTENFFCINSQASPENQAASIAFLEWLFSSDTGKAAVTNDLGLIAPFSTFSETEKPNDPLAKEVLKDMADESTTSVPWHFTSFPSIRFKDNFGAALLEYASGSKTWEQVKKQVITDWAAEKAAVAQ